MDRVNGNDWVDIGGGRRGFRSQNTAAGISGTEVTDTILNDMQEEICAVIENAGFALDPQNQQQLWEALQSIAAPGFANRAAWLPVISMTTTTPPNDAALGDAYIIPAGGTGVWTNNQQKLAEWTGSSWRIVATKDGHGVSLPDGRVFEKVAGSYVEKIALDVQSGKWAYALASGSESALVASLTPAPQELAAGLRVILKVVAANYGAVTFNLNGLGAKSVVYAVNGNELFGRDYQPNALIELLYDGTVWRLMSVTPTRIKLSAPGNYYVATSGNDATGDGSQTKPWRTIQKAIDTVMSTVDFGGNSVTVNVANGTYAGWLVEQSTPNGNLIIKGNTASPASCVINTSVTTSRAGTFSIEGFRLAPASGHSLISNLGGIVNITGAMDFAQSSGAHLYCHDRGAIIVAANYTISGGATMHLDIQGAGATFLADGTFTISGAPNFSQYFAFSALGAELFYAPGSSFVGSATGTRFLVQQNAIIALNGGGPNFFPGSSEGSSSNGGVYT